MVKSTFATACHRLRRSPLCEGGGRPSELSARRYFLLLHPGHGHWSQPQPVHALRIMRLILRPALRARARLPRRKPLDDAEL